MNNLVDLWNYLNKTLVSLLEYKNKVINSKKINKQILFLED
jgi:hypothetical protein